MQTPLLSPQEILNHVVQILADMKALQVVTLDVKGLTPITDYMVVATGTSSRHVDAIAAKLVDILKPKLARPISVDKDNDSEWALVDCGDAIVHIMQPSSRDFYALERLWSHGDAQSAQHP